MKIVIIEDEKITATDLQQTLKQIDNSLEIVYTIRSVQEGITYFTNNPAPDIIFSDIRLGDGLSFEILSDLQTPVIFCTAYDEYALNAFKANGIDYILKPFSLTSVSGALQKFKNLTEVKQEELARQYDYLKKLFSESKSKSSTFLIHHKDMIIPLKIADIAMFHLEHDIVKLITFSQKAYFPNKSLDELEKIAGEDFFRVNRQYLVNRKTILHASSILSRKLSLSISIPHKEKIIISREKSPLFFKWLTGEE